MMIKTIHLVNIKSYVDETIHFNDGINCILGLNGSGKSTIIEAIGMGLFNYNRYRNVSQMIRYKEKRGSIEIDFVADDGRVYQVIRSLKPQSSMVKILDVETGDVLEEGTENVYPFIKRLLHTSSTKEFSKMFEEIIAVPQGQFVTAFLQTPSYRKENFDKLFELHVYKDIANKLKELFDILKDEFIVVIEKDIIDLSAQTKTFDEKKALEKQMKNELEKLKDSLEKESSVLQKLVQERDEMNDKKNRLDEARNEKTIKQSKQQFIREDLKQKQVQLIQSVEAFSIVNETRQAYLKHQLNEEKIKDLERAYDELIKLEKDITNLQSNIEICKTKIQNFGAQIEELDAKEKEKNTLLQELQSECLFEKNILLSLEQKSKDSSSLLSKKKAVIEALERELNESEQQLRFYQAKYESFPIFDEDFEAINQAKTEELKKQITLNSTLQNEVDEAVKNLNFLEKDLQIAEENARSSIDGMCPFLHSKCKNINEGSLNSYFEELAQSIREKIEEKQLQVNKLREAIVDEKILAVKHSKLEEELHQFTQANSEKELMRKAIVKFFAVDESKANEALQSLILEVEKNLVNGRNKVQLLKDEITSLQQVSTEDQTNFATKKVHIKNIENRFAEHDKELKKWIFGRQDLSAKQLKEQRKMNDLFTELSALEQAQENSKNTKEELDQLKEENALLEPDKTRYIANEKKAKEKGILEEAIALSEAQLQQENKRENDLQQLIEELMKSYSVKLHEQVKLEVEKKSEKVGELKATLKERDEIFLQLLKELQIMTQLLQEKEAKEKALVEKKLVGEFIQKMRKVYTDLPTRLSQTYRDYIALAATNLYRQIARENVRLELSEDYQVRIYDDAHEDVFKSMDQLSGGEQMSVAIAIRLSMLKHLAGIDIYFLDEPTINLDVERRAKVAEVIQEATTDLSQVFVISHDDTFDDITQHVVRIEKNENVSRSR